MNCLATSTNSLPRPQADRSPGMWQPEGETEAMRTASFAHRKCPLDDCPRLCWEMKHLSNATKAGEYHSALQEDAQAQAERGADVLAGDATHVV